MHDRVTESKHVSAPQSPHHPAPPPTIAMNFSLPTQDGQHKLACSYGRQTGGVVNNCNVGQPDGNVGQPDGT